MEDVVNMEKSKLEEATKRITFLSRKLDDLENRSRRSNLRVVNLPEKVENPDAVAFLEKWLCETLGRSIFPTPHIIERAHRLPGRQNTNRPRVMIMKFLNFQDVVRVMRAARQKGRVMYGDQEIKFFPDLSAEVLRQRRRFDDIKQCLRSLNLRYGIVYPAKLRVTVNGQTREFEDPSDAEKISSGNTKHSLALLGCLIAPSLRMDQCGDISCILTSENLVQSLFPMLTKAVEKNKPILAVKFLAKAQVWIKEIITEVDRIVEKYDLHNKDVASSTSDVVKEKIETDKKITQQDHEMKQTENTLNDLKSKLQKATEELAELERKINSKNQEIQDFAQSITKTSKGLGIFAAVVPFIGLIVKSIYDAVHDPENVARMKALEAELNNLIADKTALKQKQWQLELQIIDWQMKFAKANFDRNSIPDPIYLNEVQSSLSKIQAILIQLKNFWENVGQMLKYLEQKTFVGEDLIEDLVELKDEFLESIKAAEEAWSSFGAGCKKASVIFKIQAKDAYKFLEVSPSSLSKEQWQTEYESVKEQLQKIDPVKSVTSSTTPAISE
ncbi:restin-like protein [Labeo rohita]|uniref:Restin-like protein n=1 Tax=Labeo rohita TaxID=84645 RepID=A0A498P2F3_LABRO|nr:restin-like protein [Labeo rohita]